MAGVFEKGIDVSHWNGNIDFAKVKATGRTFVMLKAGGSDNGFYTDTCFEKYYTDAKAAEMKVGAYYFPGPKFQGTANGKADAERFLNIIKGKTFEYPVALDVEAQSASTRAENTEAAIAFCEMLEKAGYYVTIYASDYSGFVSRLNLDKLGAYDKWVAKYSSAPPKYVQQYGMWQYGGSQNYIEPIKVDGVASAACDQNYSYKDYAKIIKNAGLNGFSKQAPGTAHTGNVNISIGPLTSGDVYTIYNYITTLGKPDGSIILYDVTSGDAAKIREKCNSLGLINAGLYKEESEE